MPADLPPPVFNGGDAEFTARMRALAAIPTDMRSLKHPRNWVAGGRLFVDYALTVPPRINRAASKVRQHPPPFVKHEIRMSDGAVLRGWLAVHEGHVRPTLVIIPGLFTSKDNYVVKQRAIRIFREWGYNLLTLDLRGNGESDRVPSTVGWKEAQDLLEVADWLRARPEIDKIGIYAESLAATAVVLASALAGRSGRRFADLGIMAVSGFYDVHDTLKIYSEPPRDDRKLREVVSFFRILLRLSGSPSRNFREYHEGGSQYYGRDPGEAANDSDPPGVLVHARDPILVLHSSDDTLVPERQAKRLLPLVGTCERLGVWILPWGHHCLYEMASPGWFWSVLRTFFQAEPPTASR